MTNRENHKTMVQTTDAEADDHQPLRVSMPSKAGQSKAKTQENAGISAKRSAKAGDKQKLKVLHNSSNCTENVATDTTAATSRAP